jgi:hypothetical protein
MEDVDDLDEEQPLMGRDRDRDRDRRPVPDLNETAELMHPADGAGLPTSKRRELPRPSGIKTDLSPRAEAGMGRTPKGGGMTPSSRQALQDRLKNRKKEEVDPNTPTATKEEKAARRKELLKMRQKAREAADEEEEGDDKGDDKDDDKDSPAKSKKDKDKKKEEEEPPARALVTVMLPPHIYPLEILPSRRSAEGAGHPLLVLPAPHPHASQLLSDCFGSLTRCCSGDEYFPHYEELEWGEEEEAAGAVLTAAVRNPDSVVSTNSRGGNNDKLFAATERLLQGEAGAAPAPGGGAEQDGSFSTADKHASAVDVEMCARYQEEEGLYLGRRPLLTSQLMDGEEVGLRIASMVARDLYLSRITQRILREVCGSEVYSRQRKEWAQLAGPPAGLGARERELYEGSMRLLRVVNTLHGRGPVLRVFEDPVDEAVYEAIVDNHGYDGSGGGGGGDTKSKGQKKAGGRDLHEQQFGAGSTRADMLGSIPEWGGRRGARRRRGILRVHVQTLSFTRHALMNEEELKFVEVKRVYANYRVMFEQQATGYLVYRLHALLMELARATHALHEASSLSAVDDETIADAKSLLSDVLETLPCLAELRAGLAGLTGQLYAAWGQLKEARKKQKFVSTRAVLTGRPLYFLDEVGHAYPSRSSGGGDKDKAPEQDGEDEKPFYQHLEAEVVHWNAMQELLLDLPELAENLCLQLRAHAEQKEQRKQKLQQQLKLTTTGGDAAAAAGEDASASADSDNAAYNPEFVASVVALTKQSVKDLAGQFLPLMVYRLTNLGHLTDDPQGDHVGVASAAEGAGAGHKEPLTPLDPLEAARRQSVCGLSVKLVLKVNGRAMTSTEPAPVQWPAYSASILRSFEFRVFKHLASVTLDVYLCTKGLFGLSESFVGSVPVALPYLPAQEVSAQNMAPVAGWCSFSAAAPSVVKTNQHVSSARIEGALLCGSEYEVFAEHANVSRLDGVKTNQISQLAAAGAPPAGGKGRMGVSGNVDFTRERDFHKLLPDINTLDPNDPQNEHIVRLNQQFSSGNQATRDTFVLIGGSSAAASFSENGESYANFLKCKVPDRIRLLLMRESRPYLFSEPIPLSDAIIHKSEFYRSLLTEGADDTHKAGALSNADLATKTSNADTLGTGRGQLKPIAESGDDEAGDAEAEFGDGIGLPVSKITGFLQRVRDSHTSVSRQSKQKKIATNSVISEPIQIPDQEFSLASLFKFTEAFERKRSLKPKARERKAASTILSSCDLLIQVVGSKNIPLRAQDAAAGEGKKGAATPTSRKKQAYFDEGDDDSSVTSDYDPASGRAAIAGMSRPRLDGSSSGGGGGGGGLGRQSSTANSDLLDKGKLKDKHRARTFVEVRFQDTAVCTTSVDGGAPNWKQSLSLEIRPPHDDFSPQSMETLHDHIYFTLFDEMVEDDSQRGGYFEDESTERVEKRYLGSFSIPFATVFAQGRVDGVFRLDVPAFNMGYHSGHERRMRDTGRDMAPVAEDSEYMGTAPSMFDAFFGPPSRPAANADTSYAAWDMRVDESTESEFEYFASGSAATFIKVLITLDPLLSPIVVPGLELSATSVCPTDRFLVAYAHSWLHALRAKKQTAEREYNIFGYNSDGYKVLSCRYLTPQEPPMDIGTRRGCLHLTSMIPFMPDSQAFIGAYDLWCTSQQMWDMGAGDEEEHGITLYNYLTFLASRSSASAAAPRAYGEYPSGEAVSREENFFVSGKAIPEGDSVYVLCRQPDTGAGGNPHSAKNFILINPCSGFVYSAADHNCPLFEITTLATPYNIWANIQPTSRPHEMSFDVLDGRCWRPFFCPAFPYPKGGLSSVQGPVQHAPTSQAACTQIEREIKGAIKTKFRRWRSKRTRSAALFHPGT